MRRAAIPGAWVSISAYSLCKVAQRSERAAIRVATLAMVVGMYCPSIAGVYVIRCQDYVKIGRATNIRARYQKIACETPYQLQFLYAFPCTTTDDAIALEAQLHTRFSHLRERGEWFHIRPEIRDFLHTVGVTL